jgi:hypothetical protein
MVDNQITITILIVVLIAIIAFLIYKKITEPISSGDQGKQGPPGATGIQGPPGATGIQGDQGEQDPPGATGIQGDQGSVGATGATGIQGDQGSVGATGATGIQGDQGSVGATGATGSPGAATPTSDPGASITPDDSEPQTTVPSKQIDIKPKLSLPPLKDSPGPVDRNKWTFINNKTTTDHGYIEHNDITDVWEDCIKPCEDVTRCKYVVVDTDGKRCWLKEVENPNLIDPLDSKDTRATYLKTNPLPSCKPPDSFPVADMSAIPTWYFRDTDGVCKPDLNAPQLSCVSDKKITSTSLFSHGHGFSPEVNLSAMVGKVMNESDFKDMRHLNIVPSSDTKGYYSGYNYGTTDGEAVTENAPGYYACTAKSF